MSLFYHWYRIIFAINTQFTRSLFFPFLSCSRILRSTMTVARLTSRTRSGSSSASSTRGCSSSSTRSTASTTRESKGRERVLVASAILKTFLCVLCVGRVAHFKDFLCVLRVGRVVHFKGPSLLWVFRVGRVARFKDPSLCACWVLVGSPPYPHFYHLIAKGKVFPGFPEKKKSIKMSNFYFTPLASPSHFFFPYFMSTQSCHLSGPFSRQVFVSSSNYWPKLCWSKNWERPIFFSRSLP